MDHRANHEQRNDPDRNTGHDGPSPFLNGEAADWVDDDKKPKKAEASQEEDAAVSVEVEGEADECAHEAPKDPVVSVDRVMYQERKARHIQQVCDGQVQHNDSAAFPGPHFEDIYKNDNDVPWETHQK